MIYVITIIFAAIFIQDVKYRGVHWVLFPVLLLACIYYGYEAITLDQITLNSAFLVILMLSLTLYLSLKERRIVNITKGYFSWGDILFLLAIIPLFQFHAFMVFFIAGTFVTLLIHLLVNLVKPQKTLPYAGYMSLAGIFYLFLGNRLITTYL